MGNHQNKSNPLRKIPSIDQLVRDDQLTQLREAIGTKRLTTLARLVTGQMRGEITSNGNLHSTATLLQDAVDRIKTASRLERTAAIRRVINATGVVLHTNLGRAPLSKVARAAMLEASRYCTLEYDAVTGTRGSRGSRAEFLLQQLTNAEDALVVNNCAAAALLVLSCLASDGETIVSRGELVEIGGDFRVPDVMATSGTRMIEVGTTNKTRVDDYRRAISASTRLIMRVHPSNYRIVGFASTPSNIELAGLAREAGLQFYVDAGSGQMSESSNLSDEPSVSHVIRDNADVVSFSGDKLLGSVQAGLIVGKSEIVSRLRRHPLYRALRSDKIRLAALTATLESHARQAATVEVPAASMLTITAAEVATRAEYLAQKIVNSALTIEIIAGDSAVGGGAAPTTALPTTLIALTHKQLSASEIDQRLRSFAIPIVSRIVDQKVMLDLRTVFDDEESELIGALGKL